jgi:hypothetical protein
MGSKTKIGLIGGAAIALYYLFRPSKHTDTVTETTTNISTEIPPSAEIPSPSPSKENETQIATQGRDAALPTRGRGDEPNTTEKTKKTVTPPNLFISNTFRKINGFTPNTNFKSIRFLLTQSITNNGISDVEIANVKSFLADGNETYNIIGKQPTLTKKIVIKKGKTVMSNVLIDVSVLKIKHSIKEKFAHKIFTSYFFENIEITSKDPFDATLVKNALKDFLPNNFSINGIEGTISNKLL